MRKQVNPDSYAIAPEAFRECVRRAATRAVLQPVRRGMPVSRGILVAALVLLISGLTLAAASGWRVGDFFGRKTGFVFPAYEWGSAPDATLPETVSFYGCEAQVAYQYQDDQLTAVDLTISRAGVPEGKSLSAVLEEILGEMNRNYEGEQTRTQMTEQEAEKLRARLRQELGIGEPLPEADVGEDADARSSGPLMNTWYDQKTGTAIRLSVGYDEDGGIRQIGISLSRF